jgi:hypothetical protein
MLRLRERHRAFGGSGRGIGGNTERDGKVAPHSPCSAPLNTSRVRQVGRRASAATRVQRRARGVILSSSTSPSSALDCSIGSSTRTGEHRQSNIGGLRRESFLAQQRRSSGHPAARASRWCTSRQRQRRLQVPPPSPRTGQSSGTRAAATKTPP